MSKRKDAEEKPVADAKTADGESGNAQFDAVAPAPVVDNEQLHSDAVPKPGVTPVPDVDAEDVARIAKAQGKVRDAAKQVQADLEASKLPGFVPAEAESSKKFREAKVELARAEREAQKRAQDKLPKPVVTTGDDPFAEGVDGDKQ